MKDTEKTALNWYMKNIHRYPEKDFNKITSEIKEYELMRNSFMLGVHWAECHLTSAMHTDGESRCIRCGDSFDDHCKINHPCTGYKVRRW